MVFTTARTPGGDLMSIHRPGLLLLAACAGLGGLAGVAVAQHYPPGVYQELAWRMIGPLRGGRTRALAGVPSQPNVFYVGAVNGGVWKTDDAGRTWRPIFDAQPTQSIGALAVAPSDPNVIYVGSGEGLHRPDLSVGDGIYRSADAGRTWIHLGLADAQQIPELAVDPHDPGRLFAAVLGHPFGPNSERGIYRSLDGGVTWQRVLYKDADTGGSAVAIDPSQPDIVYAGLWQSRLGPWEDKNEFQGTGGGMFKSTDGGTTWKPLTAGLPPNLIQANIAIAPSAPLRQDRKSTRLNSSHLGISYAVFCLKKKNHPQICAPAHTCHASLLRSSAPLPRTRNPAPRTNCRGAYDATAGRHPRP